MRAVKRWLIRAICHPWIAKLIYRIYRDRIPSRGFVIDPGGNHVSWHAVPRLYWGLYEKGEISFVEQYLRPNLDVVELGASLGVVSLHIAKHQDQAQRLICVEANRAMIPVIQRNMERNLRKERFEVLNLAIAPGDEREVAFEISADPLESRMALSAHDTHQDNPAKRANPITNQVPCQVVAQSLSTLLKQRQVDEYALVCDIEGAEAAILRDDPQSLQHCQQIVIEMHPRNYAEWNCDLAWLNARFVELGFICGAVRGPVAYWFRPLTTAT